QNAAGGGIQQDLNHFMHALFQSLRQDARSASASGASSSDTGTSSGLTGLITDVSKGHAPTDLQNAFDKLMGDVQSTSSGQGSDATTPTGSTTITLQDFLNKLQANLGYGGSGGNASGGILSAVA
ncbi:MAG TPA: hypothetical protein VFM48_00330, partial [Aquabacterium sp.]|nr:hypothetical protein [Aquabacterium sp.]